MADWLCTLAQAKAEMKAEGTTDDAWVLDNIPLVSQRIENWTRQRYTPYVGLYHFDAFGTQISDVYRRIDLGRPLLWPGAVLDAFGNSLTLNTDYMLYPDDPPWNDLQLVSGTVYGWSYGYGFGSYYWIAPGNFLRKIQIAGVWGYRDRCTTDGWRASGQSIQDTGGINASQTSLTVASGGSLSPGMYLQAGPSTMTTLVSADSWGHNQLSITGTAFEWLQVTAISGNTLTVQRGMNGSTAQAWPKDTALSVWSVQPEIQRAAVRWLGYWYDRRGAYERTKNDLSQGKVLVYPDDAPAEVVHILEQTRDWRWGAV